ncbi:MAG: hypothetical protein NTZ90_08005 [Proteobacteria bacterium]|nr:hypothetical protein [Pseudomonadota bacterium]
MSSYGIGTEPRRRGWYGWILTFVVWAAATSASTAPAQEGMSVAGIVKEVTSRAESPHAYDWRRASAEVQLGYGYTAEANNFDTDTVELGVGIPVSGGSLLRFGLRRAMVHGTPSSNAIGRTPFKQGAQSTRYELFGGYGFGLLEGRSMTRFSPLLPDFEQVLLAWGGAHYNHLNRTWIPMRSDPPAPLAGQDPAYAKINIEIGLRWQVYMPQSFGLSFEAIQVRPVGGSGQLRYWAYYSGGVLWSFGAH